MNNFATDRNNTVTVQTLSYAPQLQVLKTPIGSRLLSSSIRTLANTLQGLLIRRSDDDFKFSLKFKRENKNEN